MRSFSLERDALVRRPDQLGPGRRLALSALTDEWLKGLFDSIGRAGVDLCLVAVGGYGREELAPGSDIDLLLLHRKSAAAVAPLADKIWYPIWDSGISLDHSVRTPAEARRLASEDIKVVLGLLDTRVIAGDGTLAEQLRQTVFADWRAMAIKRLPTLRELVEQRKTNHGELACLLEPDLKEAYGGLRDATVLRAIAATWVTDVPHSGWPQAHSFLLDVRDALHLVTGKAGDRLLLQEQDGVATALGIADADELLRQVYMAARCIAFASDSTWHRVERLTRGPSRLSRRLVNRRGPERVPLADGVVVQSGEVLLAIEARPATDPTLTLRAPAAAAQAGLPLAPITVERLASECGPLPIPWPAPAREAFVSLLGSGVPLVRIWEAMDQAGLIESLIPYWSTVRSAPQRNAVHTFTVDRHLVETAVQASAFTREVHRPDLLLLGALLHDIGKARPGDHSEVGAEIAADLAERMGFTAEDSQVIVDLVRYHLLLVDTATRRDLEDPATVDYVTSRIDNPETLDLLHALTRADAFATGPAAWSDWRAKLVAELVYLAHARLAGHPAPAEPELSEVQQAAVASTGVWVAMEPAEDGYHLTVAAPDHLGLLSTVAGVLSLQRLQVRSARVITVGERAVQIWTVLPTFGDPPSAEQIAAQLRLAFAGAIDVGAKIRERAVAYVSNGKIVRAAPRVDVMHAVSERSTILEVRAHDEPGLLHRVTGAISAADVTITGAKVLTLGSEAVDVFFLVDDASAPLSPPMAEVVRLQVLEALQVG